MTEEVKEWWEATATSFQEAIDLDVGVNWMGFSEGSIDLLGDVEGLDVIELGCGGGQCTVAVAERGADVVGIDLSCEQLAHARSLVDEHEVDVDLLQADITDLGTFPEEAFDVAFNAWVFQWVPDLKAAFAEAARVLRPGGRLVFSMPHPFYAVVDPETHGVTGSYFEDPRRVIEHEGMDVDEVLYRHRVSDVHGALVDAGFVVEGLHEPGSADPEDWQEGPWGGFTPELQARVPPVLAVEARLPAEPAAGR